MKGNSRLVEIYTDGSCRGNPGPGGWGAIVITDGIITAATSSQSPHTTNNQMEMSAIIWALEYYGKNELIPIVWSDSAYCVNTFNTWMWNWKNNGWKRAKNKPIENLDLVKRYFDLINQGNRIDLRKIQGHAGIYYNELVDKLAKGEITIEEIMKFG